MYIFIGCLYCAGSSLQWYMYVFTSNIYVMDHNIGPRRISSRWSDSYSCGHLISQYSVIQCSYLAVQTLYIMGCTSYSLLYTLSASPPYNSVRHVFFHVFARYYHARSFIVLSHYHMVALLYLLKSYLINLAAHNCTWSFRGVSSTSLSTLVRNKRCIPYLTIIMWLDIKNHWPF